MSTFEKLSSVNVNEHTEKKNNLTYLSWAWAWSEFKKVYPEATYKIWRDEEGRPYIFDPRLGYMVFTSVTVGDLTHEMWLPVMDNKNSAMKDVKYQFKRGYKTIDVEPATMFDVNTAIMRCLVKNLAMFGLGLYIYAGEDIPEEEKPDPPKGKVKSVEQVSDNPKMSAHDRIVYFCNEHQLLLEDVAERYGLEMNMPEEVYEAKLEQMRKDYDA